jgi:hypothetical protein
MKLIEHLGGFSVDDLRELARRRGVLLRQDALRDRQTLLRTLSSVLTGYEGAHVSLAGLNQAELGALTEVLRQGRKASVSNLASALEADPAGVRSVLDSLRLWGLIFPEGSWDHIGVPPTTQQLTHYLTANRGPQPKFQLTPPTLEKASAEGLEPRPGRYEWDIAEFLARIGRSRLKLTQAGKMNRRDLRAMEAAFSIPGPAYSFFIYQMALGSSFLTASRSGMLALSELPDVFFGQDSLTRAKGTLETWRTLRGFPEGSTSEPEDTEYLPSQTFRQRAAAVQLFGEVDPGAGVPAASVADRLRWLLPRSFDQWEGNRSPEIVARRLLRTLTWLGLLISDSVDAPTRVALTPLGGALLKGGVGDGLIPDEPHFFLQPNAETFSPPNLAPRTLFHLRRITGEKKGGPAGVYPLTQESLRRALDTGSRSEEIVAFLETFSRTGVPDTVRRMIETVGRQHGRIRLVPAEYVLVTEDPTLLQELRGLKPIQPILGRPLTERAVSLAAEDAAEVLRRLRARGYSPVDESHDTEPPPLPSTLDSPPLPPESQADPDSYQRVGDLDWSHVNPQPEPLDTPQSANGLVYEQSEIRDLLHQAEVDHLVVEIEYKSRNARVPTTRSVWPIYVDSDHLEAFCEMRDEERYFTLSRIQWARLTGETFPVE